MHMGMGMFPYEGHGQYYFHNHLIYTGSTYKHSALFKILLGKKLNKAITPTTLCSKVCL
uniref:Uncharacterized protein n=1 Tax=Candidatus Kentrum sp. FW TaxID=2126338 RepID=A0A450TMR7_9GAMM|nr:MAG: hypothetical protein BECKFW1821C_GA0114237_101724 [Candidatus Kentron sp. FW]